MRSYGQYCPLALGAEVFAQRWTPLIIRNLHLGSEHFGELLDGAPGLPRSVLVERLRRLERDGVVACRRNGHTTVYTLTEMGSELHEVCLALAAWGARWREARPVDEDPYLALWTMSRLIDGATLPQPRVVVRFEVRRGRSPDRLWMVLDPTGNEVCVRSPGYAEDGVVVADAGSLVRWYAGKVSLEGALQAGAMTVRAPPWLERELAHWGGLSSDAGVLQMAARP